MAINPVSDIVLDVVRAADPADYRAATARLRELAGAASPETFEKTSDRLGKGNAFAPHLPFDAARALLHLRNGHALAERRADPYERFEAFVLQTFIQSMLPKGDSALFGSGTAGEIWKSMLARGLGAELARSGGIGIAEMLASVRDGGDDRPAAVAAVTQDSDADA